ncbi:hypothetical protein Tco_0272631 [Tanacetum coccineum]
MTRGLDMFGDVQEPVLTVRKWNLRSPRLVLCGNLVAEMQQVTPRMVEIFVTVDVARRSRLRAWLRA